MGVLAVVLVMGVFVALVRLWYYIVRRAVASTPDPALCIKPPRRILDGDGRADFRPERYDIYTKRDVRELVRWRVAAVRAKKDGRNG
jgi:hypothetical protein